MDQPEHIPTAALLALVRTLTSSTDHVVYSAMPGGASTRRFARVELSAGHTAVAMYLPEAARSDEITKDEVTRPRWPFLEIRELLESRGVRVPRLVAEACHHGLILVEDLGDETLALALRREPERLEELYRLAVCDLAKSQLALAKLPPGSVVSSRQFDVDLLKWEVDHFREWAWEARGIELSPSERADFDRAAQTIAEVIAAWPRGFVHRDYQSRNLMLRRRQGSPAASDELVWIDFQDALLGPRVYDLVALLNDSYQDLDDAFISDRLMDYATVMDLSPAERSSLALEFAWVTVQRKLKDAGRFVFIEHKKGDSSYLPFVTPTITKALRSLERLRGDPRLSRLRELILRHSPEAACALH